MRKILAPCLFVILLIFSACQQNPMADPPADKWIAPAEVIDMENMSLYWQHDNMQFPYDKNAKLSIYVDADKHDSGEFLFDDRQEWMVLLETSLGNYPLFARQPIQLGAVSCVALNDYADDDTIFHVLITIQQSAGYQLYDCIYNSEKNAFRVIPVYEAMAINLLADSKVTAASSVSNDNAAKPAEETVISIHYASDVQFDEHHFFADESITDSAIADTIVLSTNTAARDFHFIELGYKEENHHLKYFQKSILFSLSELSPEKPLVVTWLEQGLVPHRGISFVDEKGVTRYFYIVRSHKDELGTLFLVEFE